MQLAGHLFTFSGRSPSVIRRVREGGGRGGEEAGGHSDRSPHKCRSLDEWVRATKINAMPLVEIPVNVNHVLILSNPLPCYHGARPPLVNLFVVSWRPVMGTSLGDKVVIVIALLLLAVVAVVSAEFPGIIRAARFVAAL